MVLNKQHYDILKFLAQIGLPALGTLYFTISQIWGLEYGTEVLGTITAVDTFLGVALGISTAAYKKSDEPYAGNLVMTEDEDKMTASLELKDDITNLKHGDVLSFKVQGP